VFRTSIVWEGLREPVQVVQRSAPLRVEGVKLDVSAGDAAKQLYQRFDPRRVRMSLSEAPLVRAYTVFDEERQRWLLLLLLHHLVSDHTTLDPNQAIGAPALRGCARGWEAGVGTGPVSRERGRIVGWAWDPCRVGAKGRTRGLGEPKRVAQT